MQRTATPQFHLSIAVRSVEESADFFVTGLNASIAHRDASGYINLDWHGAQSTLTSAEDVASAVPGLHFGFNLPAEQFDEVAENLLASRYSADVNGPIVADAGTAMDRKKLYVRCPSGYRIELKTFARPR